MDLKELSNTRVNRHPWEISRLKALKRILHTVLIERIKVLDVGCGDGFISNSLFHHLKHKDITAVDINFTDELISKLNNRSSAIKYQREMPSEGIFDLILLLDVIEHTEYDQKFLSNLVETYAEKKGKVIITAPAFQFIYSRHDSFLGHYRRYNLKELEKLAAACNLNVLSSGYLFFSLLLPKLLLYKLLNTDNQSDGVGKWNRGKIISSFIERSLNFDNSILISASRFGIKIPGLSGWILCEKRE